MGANLARLAMEKDHSVVGFNKDPSATQEVAGERLEPADSIEEFASELASPRTAPIYFPHPEPTEEVCRDLGKTFGPGDIVIDGATLTWSTLN
jgi:6-phosphogluconate dehydrogenase